MGFYLGLGVSLVIGVLLTVSFIAASKREKRNQETQRRQIEDLQKNFCRSCGFAFGDRHPNHCDSCGARQHPLALATFD